MFLKLICLICDIAFSAVMLLVGHQEERPARKKNRVGACVVIFLERGADLHTAQHATHCLLLQQNPDWFYLFGCVCKKVKVAHT